MRRYAAITGQPRMGANEGIIARRIPCHAETLSAPITGRGPEGDIEQTLPRFRQMLSEAGRDPQSVPVTLFGATEDAERLVRYRDLGIARVVVMLPSVETDQMLPMLDRWAALIERTR